MDWIVLKEICTEACRNEISTYSLFSYEYRWECDWEPLPRPDDIKGTVRFHRVVSTDRWIWSLIKHWKDLYIWAVNLVQFIKYDWEDSIKWMADFIFKYWPDVVLNDCEPYVYKFYLYYKKKKWNS